VPLVNNFFDTKSTAVGAAVAGNIGNGFGAIFGVFGDIFPYRSGGTEEAVKDQDRPGRYRG